jgi:hypothetical protein
MQENMADWAFEALLEQAHVMAGYWQVFIRVETGAARDSIRVERGGEGRHWKQVKVRGGGYVVNPKTGRLVDYMWILERKYGAGRAALEQVRSTIRDMIEANVVNSISAWTQ